MLAQRLRRRPNMKTSLFQRVVFAGNESRRLIAHSLQQLAFTLYDRS